MTEFKKPEELGLTKDEYCGLVKTMEALQSGKIEHNRNSAWPHQGNGFNMGVWNTQANCGTTCCIGGWSEKLQGLPYGTLSEKSNHRGMRGLHALFYQRVSSNITPQEGARAIENYLKTGSPNWNEAAPRGRNKPPA